MIPVRGARVLYVNSHILHKYSGDSAVTVTVRPLTSIYVGCHVTPESGSQVLCM